MTLRELLKCAGNMVRLHRYAFIHVVPIDRRRDDTEFEVGWDNDSDGSGPEYEYFAPDSDSWKPAATFYGVPEEADAVPNGLEGIEIDWNDAGWMISMEDWREIEKGMKKVQRDFERVKEALYEYKNCVGTSNVPE